MLAESDLVGMNIHINLHYFKLRFVSTYMYISTYTIVLQSAESTTALIFDWI